MSVAAWTPALPRLKSMVYLGPEKHRGFSMPEMLVLGDNSPTIRGGRSPDADEDEDQHDVHLRDHRLPKGVMLTSRNIVNNGFFIGERQTSPADRWCCVTAVPLLRTVLGIMAIATHGSMIMVSGSTPS